MSDPSARVVLRAEAVPTGRMVRRTEDALSAAWGYAAGPPVPERANRYELVDAKRFPLGTPYPDIARKACRLMEYLGERGRWLRRDRERGTPFDPWAEAPPPEDPEPPLLAIDATGVGKPVVDLVLAANPPGDVMPIVITGGYEARAEGGVWYVPKKDLVSAVRLLLDSGRLAWPASMPEAEVLEAELRNFRTLIGPALHESYSHREGEHDDLLLALACAVWAAEHSVYAAINGMT